MKDLDEGLWPTKDRECASVNTRNYFQAEGFSGLKIVVVLKWTLYKVRRERVYRAGSSRVSHIWYFMWSRRRLDPWHESSCLEELSTLLLTWWSIRKIHHWRYKSIATERDTVNAPVNMVKDHPLPNGCRSHPRPLWKQVDLLRKEKQAVNSKKQLNSYQDKTSKLNCRLTFWMLFTSLEQAWGMILNILPVIFHQIFVQCYSWWWSFYYLTKRSLPSCYQL